MYETLAILAAFTLIYSAVAGISKSFLYPEVGFGAGYGAGQLSGESEPPQSSGGAKTFQNWDAGFTLSWEIDLFGRIRRTNEAAFARYLATEQGRRGVLITLVAANANVGAAKALFYPSISLTGLLGGMSRDLGDITKSDAAVWNLSAGLLQPIFQGGRIKRNYEAAQARFQQAMGEYRRAALDGYREVADSLVVFHKLGEKRGVVQTGVDALRDAARLSRVRYDSGLSSYIEILLADRDLFEQERLLAQTRGEEMRAFVRLNRALGGGWQPEPETTAPSGTSP